MSDAAGAAESELDLGEGFVGGGNEAVVAGRGWGGWPDGEARGGGENRHARARGLDHPARGGDDWWWGAAEQAVVARGRAIRSEKARVCLLRFRFFFFLPLSFFSPKDGTGTRAARGLGEIE